MKPVNSKDPLKPYVVGLLKEVSEGNKVTLVTEVARNTYTGHCLKYVGGAYESLGFFEIVLNHHEDEGPYLQSSRFVGYFEKEKV